MPAEKDRELTALNDALNKLEVVDPRKRKVVELRYFRGLSVEETAAMLNLSPIAVLREWAFAKAWLAREVHNGN